MKKTPHPTNMHQHQPVHEHRHLIDLGGVRRRLDRHAEPLLSIQTVRLPARRRVLARRIR